MQIIHHKEKMLHKFLSQTSFFKNLAFFVLIYFDHSSGYATSFLGVKAPLGIALVIH